MQFTDLVFRKY